MGWKISDKPTVDPKDTDLALIEQDGNTRNTTWAKLKAFFLGTATLTTTDQTIKGAINEIKASTDANTTSLSDFANKRNILTYYTLEQLGITTSTTLANIITAMPNNSCLQMDLRNAVTITDTLPSDMDTYSMLEIKKVSSSRIKIDLSSGNVRYTRWSSNGTMTNWNRVGQDDSGWLSLPLSSDVVADLQYRKIGNLVNIRGTLSIITNNSKIIGTLPSGFRPTKSMWYMASLTGNSFLIVNVGTNGQLICNLGMSSGSADMNQITFLIN